MSYYTDDTYNEETRYTYRRMIAVMFVGEPLHILSDSQKYWGIIAEYFTHE